MAIQSNKTKSEKAKLVIDFLMDNAQKIVDDFEAVQDFEDSWVIEQALNYPEHIEALEELHDELRHTCCEPNIFDVITITLHELGIKYYSLDLEEYDEDENCDLNIVNDLEFNHGDVLEEVSALKIISDVIQDRHLIDRLINCSMVNIVTNSYDDCVVISVNFNDEWAGVEDWGGVLEIYGSINKTNQETEVTN